MKQILYFTFIHAVLFVTVAAAQPKEESLKFARAGYELEQQGKYPEALYKYNQCIAIDPTYPYPVQRIAAMYQKLHNYPKAIQFYHRAIALDSSFDDYNFLNLALCYRTIRKQDSALYAYRLFIRKVKPVLKEDTLALGDAHFYVDYMDKSADIRKAPKNTDDPEPIFDVNSKYFDYAPTVRADGKLLFFTSRRPSTNKEMYPDTKDFGDDIFFTLKNDSGKWMAPSAVPSPVNSFDDEGAASLSADGQTIYYSICRRPDGSGDCDLYQSELHGLNFSAPKNLGRQVNSREWDGQPSVSADGNQLYFSSKRNGSIGGSEDIWAVYRNPDGTWGVPQNLGNVVNTPASERSPFIAADGKTLYFSSNGHPGYGDHDLFVTRKQDDNTWSVPQNLGSPINSSGEDEFLTIPARGDKIIYSSEREGNDYDIYEAKLPPYLQPAPVTLIVGKVYDKRTKNPIGAKLEVVNLEKDELLAVYNANSSTGEFFITLPVGFEYGITATSPGYSFFSDHYTPHDTTKYHEITYNIYLSPIDTTGGGQMAEDTTVVPLNNIFFDFNKATLRKQSITELNNVVKFLKQYPKLKIELSGHTDSIGTEEINRKLSQERAEAVRRYFIDHGIASARVTAKGYGATKPVAPNDTEENRQKNRRTEFLIIRKNQ